MKIIIIKCVNIKMMRIITLLSLINNIIIIQDEYKALINNQTWTLVPFDSSMNLVGCKWMYKVKRKSDGSIEMYQTRLMAQGFRQIEVDFNLAYNPVVKLSIIRIILSIAVSRGYISRELDVKNAFQQCELHELVFMNKPSCYENIKLPNHVCRLNKTIYDLKQAHSRGIFV